MSGKGQEIDSTSYDRDRVDPNISVVSVVDISGLEVIVQCGKFNTLFHENEVEPEHTISLSSTNTVRASTDHSIRRINALFAKLRARYPITKQAVIIPCLETD